MLNYLIFFFLFIITCFIWYRISNQETLQGNLSKLTNPVVIFDFDGTICPSYHLFIDELNILSDSYGHRKIQDEERESLRDLSAKEVLRFLGISSWTLPFLIKKLRHNVQTHILELKPVQGMPNILRELKGQGVSMGILTSNSEENVLAWLKIHNLNLFDFIYTGNNLFGKDKHLTVITNKIPNASQINIYYVGDEVRDIEAAHQAHLKGIAVTWGYNSQKILLAANPDYLFTEAKDLASLLITKKPIFFNVENVKQ